MVSMKMAPMRIVHLTGDRGWPRHAIITKPVWTPGKKGLE